MKPSVASGTVDDAASPVPSDRGHQWSVRVDSRRRLPVRLPTSDCLATSCQRVLMISYV